MINNTILYFYLKVCAALRKMTSVLRLGVYRERIEKYGGRANTNNTEELLTVTLERQPGKHLGIRISGSCPEPGIFIVEILEDSITANDGRIKPYDRLLFINGTDVRHCKISQASDLIKVSFIDFSSKFGRSKIKLILIFLLSTGSSLEF